MESFRWKLSNEEFRIETFKWKPLEWRLSNEKLSRLSKVFK